MNFDKVISALSSRTRREIIKILSKGPLNTGEILEEIKKTRKIKIKHRESVYRALQKLVDSGLVEKYYNKEKHICYKLATSKIILDIVKGEIKENDSL